MKKALSIRLNQTDLPVGYLYSPYGITFTVTTDEPFTGRSWDADGDGVLKAEGTSFFSEYTDEMRALNQAYTTSRGVDDKSAYLFVFEEESASGSTLLGDMPLESRFGYLFGYQPSPIANKTIAHELGHGLLQLRHTFSSRYEIEQATTNNLMDYTSGTTLVKYQWDAIHDPQQSIFAWWQGEDEMAFSGIIAMELHEVEFSGDNKFDINTDIGDNTPAIAYHGSEDQETIKIKIKPRFEATEENTANRFWSKIKVFAGEDEEPLYEGDPQRVRKPAFKDYYKPGDYWELELPNQVGFYPDFRVEYYTSLAEDGDFEKMEDGTDNHRLYTTLRERLIGSYADERLLYFTCNQAAGETNEENVINNIWNKFEIKDDDLEYPTGNLLLSDFNPNNSSTDQFGYYLTHKAPTYESYYGALESGSGTCNAFAGLFRFSLAIQGIESTPKSYPPLDVSDRLMIKQWDFVDDGNSSNPDYPYINIFEDGWQDEQGRAVPQFTPSTGEYHWATTPDAQRIINGEKNLAGHGNPNPPADFGLHTMIKLNGSIYDPSYGKVFNDIDYWVENAVDGYYYERKYRAENEKEYNAWFIRGKNP